MSSAKRKPASRRSSPPSPQIARWGHSLALRIPSELTRQLGLKEGSKVRFHIKGDTLMVEPRKTIPTLDELLEGVTPDNAGGEMWGNPVGKERL